MAFRIAMASVQPTLPSRYLAFVILSMRFHSGLTKLHAALATISSFTVAPQLSRSRGRAPLLVTVMRPYMQKCHDLFRGTSEPIGVDNIHPPKKMRAVLEMIAPQVHEGDHETMAEIFHVGSQESLAKELVRLFIYLEANQMTSRFKEVTGCDIGSGSLMEFLRGMGFLNKANIEWLGRSTDLTSQAFLSLLLNLSIIDENSLDVLKWLIPSRFSVSQLVKMFQIYFLVLSEKFDFMRESDRIRHDHFYPTLLHASSLAGNIKAVRFLLDLGIDPYHTSGAQDYSPLECAASLTDHVPATIIGNLLLSKKTRRSFDFQKIALDRALRLAIAHAHTELIKLLLLERKRLGHVTISSQLFTTCARYAVRDTTRLLIEHASRDDDGSIVLPRDILFQAVFGLCQSSYYFTKTCDRVFDQLNYLLELGANPSVLRCSQTCERSFILCCVIGYASLAKLTEDCLLELVQLLRKHGCPLERPRLTPTDHQPSQLQRAIYGGFPRVVEYLLDWGAEIDYYRHEPGLGPCSFCHPNRLEEKQFFGLRGRSPLLTALWHGQVDIAKILLRRKPDLKLYGGEQKLAMKCGDETELVTMLLQAGSVEVDGWEDFLEQAILRRNRRSMELLLSTDTDGLVAIDSITVLRAALLTGDHVKAYQQLSVCGYDSRALFEAVSEWHRFKVFGGIVERLLEMRPNSPNDDYEVRAVASAAQHHGMHFVRALVRGLGQGPWIAEFPLFSKDDDEVSLSDWVPDDTETYSAHILCYAGELDERSQDETILKILLDANVPTDGALIQCLLHASPETFKRVIAAGADPNSMDALLQMVQYNMLEHAEVLCDAKVSLNTMHRAFISDVRISSRTPVQLAVERSSPEMLQLLMQYGADVNHPAGYYRGATCLQLAAGAGMIGLVRFLLDKGAKVNAKRALLFGRTAIEIAAENGRLDVLKLLLLQEESLIQTPAGRYQFIRATKLAECHDYGSIVKMLRQQINWNDHDQQLFDDIQRYESLDFQFDEMTQEALESDKRKPRFWRDIESYSHHSRPDGTSVYWYDTHDIKSWVGEVPDEMSYDSSVSDTDYSSETESTHLEDSLATCQHRNVGDDEFPPNLHHPEELVPIRDVIDDAIITSEDLHHDRVDGESATQSRPLSPHLGYRESTTALAPHAMRYEDIVPGWLDMQEIDDMMQGVTHDFTEHVDSSVHQGFSFSDEEPWYIDM